MPDLNILSIQAVLENGIEFVDGKVCYSGEYGQQVCHTTENGGEPISDYFMRSIRMGN